MLRHERSAPIWLFSFVDLAFLLLIAFTQLGRDQDPSRIDVAELEIPRIHGPGRHVDGSQPRSRWQLRVLPPDAAARDRTDRRAAFELVEPSAHSTTPSVAIDAADLDARLRLLRDRRTEKPILAPHRDARSEDLLVAVSLVEGVWQRGRNVAVRPGPSPRATTELDREESVGDARDVDRLGPVAAAPDADRD